MTDESYYKYWALVALDARDVGYPWAYHSFYENMASLTFQRMK